MEPWAWWLISGAIVATPFIVGGVVALLERGARKSAPS